MIHAPVYTYWEQLAQLERSAARYTLYLARLRDLQASGYTYDPYTDGPDYQDDTNRIDQHITFYSDTLERINTKIANLKNQKNFDII